MLEMAIEEENLNEEKENLNEEQENLNEVLSVIEYAVENISRFNLFIKLYKSSYKNKSSYEKEKDDDKF